MNPFALYWSIIVVLVSVIRRLPTQLLSLILLCAIKFFFFFLIIVDVPTQMPPLTPGTNKKMIEVLKESFKSWEEAAQDRNITKGKYCFCLSVFIIRI